MEALPGNSQCTRRHASSFGRLPTVSWQTVMGVRPSLAGHLLPAPSNEGHMMPCQIIAMRTHNTSLLVMCADGSLAKLATAAGEVDFHADLCNPVSHSGAVLAVADQFVMSAVAAGVVLPSALTMADKAMAATPKKGGTMRYGVGHGSTTDSLDSGTFENSFMTNTGMTFGNHLTEIGSDGQLRPELAESYESSDAKTDRKSVV